MGNHPGGAAQLSGYPNAEGHLQFKKGSRREGSVKGGCLMRS